MSRAVQRSFATLFLAAAFGLVRPATAAEVPQSPNVILVSIDTLRADHLPSYGYPTDTAPFIRSLAANGILFEEALVPLPSTTPSHGSLLTSLAPPQHGSLSLITPLSKNVDTLAAALVRRGYATGGFVAVSHLARAFNFAKGFEAFTQPAEVQRDGTTVNADAITWVDQERSKPRLKPLFLFVHYFDVHGPYGWWKEPQRTIDEATALPLEERVRRYDESIGHVDAVVKSLYTQLSVRGILDNAILCITSDHGEQIGDRGLAFGHADIYRETVRVPLIIVGKDIPVVRVGRPVSSMDVGVSLLTWVGARFAAPVTGQNILPKRGSALGRATYWLNGGGSTEERRLLVTGNPPYTRSIALAQGKYWLIKNLDAIYKQVRIGTAIGRPRERLRAVPLTTAAADGLTYTIPAATYEPVVTTVDYYPGSECPAEIIASIPPQLPYFSTVSKSSPVRFQFAAARLDSVGITIKPRSCNGRLTYRMDRPGSEPPMQNAIASITTLYGTLLAERKAHGGDELYDVSADPGMTANLIASPQLSATRRQMERTLRELYATTYGKADGNDTGRVSREELEKLRSLGYLVGP